MVVYTDKYGRTDPNGTGLAAGITTVIDPVTGKPMIAGQTPIGTVRTEVNTSRGLTPEGDAAVAAAKYRRDIAAGNAANKAENPVVIGNGASANTSSADTLYTPRGGMYWRNGVYYNRMPDGTYVRATSEQINNAGLVETNTAENQDYNDNGSLKTPEQKAAEAAGIPYRTADQQIQDQLNTISQNNRLDQKAQRIKMLDDLKKQHAAESTAAAVAGSKNPGVSSTSMNMLGDAQKAQLSDAEFRAGEASRQAQIKIDELTQQAKEGMTPVIAAQIQQERANLQLAQQSLLTSRSNAESAAKTAATNDLTTLVGSDYFAGLSPEEQQAKIDAYSALSPDLRQAITSNAVAARLSDSSKLKFDKTTTASNTVGNAILQERDMTASMMDSLSAGSYLTTNDIAGFFIRANEINKDPSLSPDQKLQKRQDLVNEIKGTSQAKATDEQSDLNFYAQLLKTNPALAEDFANKKGYNKEQKAVAATSAGIPSTGFVSGSEKILKPGEDNPFTGHSGGDLTWRSNNPGAITASTLEQANQLADRFGAIKGLYSQDALGKYVLNFATPEAGDKAMLQLLTESYSNQPTRAIGAVWTGGTGDNHVALLQQAGFTDADLNTPFGQLTPDKQAIVQQVIKQHEGLKTGTDITKQDLPGNISGSEPLDNYNKNVATSRILYMVSGASATDKERQNIKEQIDTGVANGKTVDDVMKDYIGYTIQNKDDKPFADMILTTLSSLNLPNGLKSVDPSSFARLINSGNKEAAITKLENTVMNQARTTEPDYYVSTSSVRGATTGVNTLEKYINDLNNTDENNSITVPMGLFGKPMTLQNGGTKNPIGNFSGTAEQWLGRFKSPEAQKIATQVTQLTKEFTKNYLGSAMTESEIAFYSSLIPNLNDSAENFVTKLESLKTNPLMKLNSIRQTYGLPVLDENSLMNPEDKLKLYQQEAINQSPTENYLNQTHDSVNSPLDIYITSLGLPK